MPNVACISADGLFTTPMRCSKSLKEGARISFPMSSNHSAKSGLVAVMLRVRKKVFSDMLGHRALIRRQAAICSAFVPSVATGSVCRQSLPSIMALPQMVCVFCKSLSEICQQRLGWSDEVMVLHPRWCKTHLWLPVNSYCLWSVLNCYQSQGL